jgi:hypothetical protein
VSITQAKDDERALLSYLARVAGATVQSALHTSCTTHLLARDLHEPNNRKIEGVRTRCSYTSVVVR